MKFEIGDKVVIFHTNEEGEVVDFINKKMALVKVKGQEIPVFIDQLDHPYFDMFTKPKPEEKKGKIFIDNVKKEKPLPAIQEEDGVWLRFFPVFGFDEFGDEYVTIIKVYLINRTKDGLKFNYKTVVAGSTIFQFSNTIAAFDDFYLHDVAFEMFNGHPQFETVFSLAEPIKTKADEYQTHLKIKAKQLFIKIEELQQKNEPSFSYKIMDAYPDKPVKEYIGLDKLSSKGYKIYDAGDARNHLPAARSVVDLHIEKISNNWEHLSNFEILDLQIKTFEKFFDLAVLHRLPSMVVVHGIGEGVLRTQIHELLKTRRQVASFVNQHDNRFGFGATEIFFQTN